MHQLIDKKNKIILYLLLLFVLSTTSGKFEKNHSNYSSKINQINIEGLSKNDNLKIYNELDNLFYQNILLVDKEKIQKTISKYNIIFFFLSIN
jgi:cell division protein FtsQ